MQGVTIMTTRNELMHPSLLRRNGGNLNPPQTKVQIHDVSPNRHGSPGNGISEMHINNNITFGTSYDEKIDDTSISSSSSGLLVEERQQQHTSYDDSIRDKSNETEPHTVSFDLDNSDNGDGIQQALQRYRTPQRSPRKRCVASSSPSPSSSTSFFPPSASPPKLCLGDISDIVDNALTRVADAMFDGMRCGMDDTCHRWTYVPGEDSP